MWRSLLSWINWPRRRRLKQIQEQERQRHLMLQQLIPALLAAMEPLLHRYAMQQRDSLHNQLMEMAGPLSLALSRQDQRREETQEETVSLLMDVLNSLQPSPQQQLLPEAQTPIPSSLVSAISAGR
jgi:hypothetical protein